jgi:hypothetical protein
MVCADAPPPPPARNATTAAVTAMAIAAASAMPMSLIPRSSGRCCFRRFIWILPAPMHM